MTLLNLIGYIGTPAIFVALICIGRKLQVLDTLSERMGLLERKVESLYARFIRMESRLVAFEIKKFVRTTD